MIILVSDTSVLIDLERGGLLEPAFSCGLTMVVPDLLYDRELASDNGPLLRQLGLGVVELAPDEVSFAQQLRTLRPGLSLLRPELRKATGPCTGKRRHAVAQGSQYPAMHSLWTAVDPRSDGGQQSS